MQQVQNIKLAAVVGAAIARRRKEKGFTQAEFAEYLEIGQDSLSRMEKGVIAPKFSRLSTIAAGLDCTVAELFLLPSDSAVLQARLLEEKIATLPESLQEIVFELVEQIVQKLKKVQ